MKLINIKNTGLLIASLAVAAIGCKKQDFTNTQPDLITEATYDYKTILPASQTATATIVEGTTFKFLQNWLGYWARSGSYQDITDEETYDFTNDFNAAVWNNLYANANNYALVIKGASEKKAGIYEAIARIMKAHDFQMLVDIYGNLPYTEAFQGLDIKTPKYDKGRDVYDSLFVELDKAIALLKDDNVNTGAQNFDIVNNDLIYGSHDGDTLTIPTQITSWIKFANTLKLRMLVHCYALTDFDLAGKAAIIANEGTGFIGAGESALLNPGYSGSKPTPFYRAYSFTETGVAAAQGAQERANSYSAGDGSIPGYYEYDGDPRLTRFYQPVGGGYKGIPYGQTSGTVPGFTGSETSKIDGPGYIPDGAASRAWILTDFESLFLQSEANARGIITTGSAKDLCNAGILQSYLFLGLTQQDYDDYLVFNGPQTGAPDGFPDVWYDNPDGGIFTILSQKWFALNGIAPFEVYTDWRRTDVVYGDIAGFLPGPPLSANPNRDADAAIPIRLFYPQSEYNYNAANVAAQGTIVVSNSLSNPSTILTNPSRIFWDLN